MRTRTRHTLVTAIAACLLLGGTELPTVTIAAAAPASERQLDFKRWGPVTQKLGSLDHTRLTRAGIVIGKHADQVTYRDPFGSARRVRYDRGHWTSPWVAETFGLTELIASYDVTTPVGTFVEIEARGRTPHGNTSSWDSLGRWASHDTRFHRMSLRRQGDDLSTVATDTLRLKHGRYFRSWQLRVTLMRHTGTTASPTVRAIGAVVSRLDASKANTSRPGPARGVDLRVPRYSQMIHQGEYPQWNGGGEAWCSPTSTSMVLEYWDAGPTPKQYAWVRDSFKQPWVDYAARYTYASGYDGTGDWPFNTAYAARFGLDTFVTRLRSLRQAELFAKAGIPLVASIAFDAGELDGSPIDSTPGHLLVIRGFTANGDVIANDPAAATARTVRRVYNRGQFERAWVGGSGGTVYVIHPANIALPERGAGRAW